MIGANFSVTLRRIAFCATKRIRTTGTTLSHDCTKNLKAKREPLLVADGFRTREPDEDDWQYPDLGQEYWNQYGRIFFQNINANRGRAQWFTDYYEERP